VRKRVRVWRCAEYRGFTKGFTKGSPSIEGSPREHEVFTKGDVLSIEGSPREVS
jgi:hypothetical protein